MNTYITYRKAATIAAMALGSCVAALLTLSVVVEYHLGLKTLGLSIASLTGWQPFNPSKAYVLALSVDSVFYFVLVTTSAALFRRRLAKGAAAVFSQRSDANQSALSLIVKSFLHILSAAVLAIPAVWETELFVLKRTDQFGTPGSLVWTFMKRQIPHSGIDVGSWALVTLGVDFILYFAVFWSLIALIRRSFGRRRLTRYQNS